MDRLNHISGSYVFMYLCLHKNSLHPKKISAQTQKCFIFLRTLNTNTPTWELIGKVTWVNTNFAQEKKHQSKKYYFLFKVKSTKVKSTIYSK